MDGDAYRVVEKVIMANGLELESLRCERLPFSKMPIDECLKLVFTEASVDCWRRRGYRGLRRIVEANIFKAVCKRDEYVFMFEHCAGYAVFGTTQNLSSIEIADELISSWNGLRLKYERLSMSLHEIGNSRTYADDIKILADNESFYEKAIELDLAASSRE